MSTQFEQIVERFIGGEVSLEITCQQLAREVQAHPDRTRFWGQRVEAELKRQRISAAAARAMLDALEGFQCDKTMWIDPVSLSHTGAAPQGPNSPSASASNRTAQSPPTIESTEQLRAALFAPITRRRGDTIPVAFRDANALSVEWMDGPSKPSMSEALETLPLGTVINDRYRLITHLGAGGIGQVFDAIDLSQPGEAHITLKIVAVNLKHQPSAFEALQAAVRRTMQLNHPNIVRIYDIDRFEDRVFITMEPLRGRWLSAIVREARNKGMPYGSAWPIIEGIANGLAHAHAHGVVHSDLSPHAIFVCEDGTAKIMGFGLVHAVPASNESLDVLDTLTLRAYTEAYTADAWAQQGEPHPADDLYPLGVIAYEMLTGAHPFGRCSLSVARQKGLTCAPIRGLNRRARKLIEKCLSFERNVRPKDAHSFLRRMRPGVFRRLWVATGASS
ncbi:MAG TPA: serine/threonine-protein kinase [Steroidobacteraceae bacterium]